MVPFSEAGTASPSRTEKTLFTPVYVSVSSNAWVLLEMKTERKCASREGGDAGKRVIGRGG